MKKQILIILLLILCPVLCRAQRYVDREIKNGLFVPKGAWLGGCAFSYNEHLSEDLHFLIIDNINSEGYTFKVSPFVGYFIKDNMAVGLRGSYSRTLIDLGTIDVNLGDDLSFKLKDNKYKANNFTVSGFMRTYMSIGGGKIFGFFNDVRVTYGYGEAKFSQPDENNSNAIRGTYQTKHKMQIGAAPGLTAFVTNFASVEVSVDVVGLNFNWIKQNTNQVENSSMHNSSANFKIDLFSINIGMCVYL
ncbi:hypothetical protein [Phocaeicola sp.]